MKRATIKDIAKLTGYAVSTISRALKGHPDISDRAKSKIITVAKAIGYRPNLGARSLRTQSSNLIGVILPKAHSFFFPELLEGISTVTEAEGYTFLFLQSDNSYQKEIELLELCVQMSVDGVLISLSMETKDVHHLKTLLKSGVPVVQLDRVLPDKDLPAICIDDSKVARLAIEFLIEKGHRRIIGVFDDPRLEITKLRESGFRKALADKNIPYDEQQVLKVGRKDPFDALMKQCLNQYQDTTAIFTMSDKMLVQVYSTVSHLGYQIPGQLALISISEGKAPYYFHPAITHMCHSGAEVGSRAAMLLFQHIKGINTSSHLHFIDAPLQDLGSV